MAKLIDNFLHRHPLVLVKGKEANHRVICKGCRKGLSGSAYGCRPCRFYLHKHCAELPEEIQNFFHQCPLLLTLSDNNYICNACFKRGSGFTYLCKGCDFYMHVECAKQPAIESDEELIQHFTHWHPLKCVDPNKHLEVGCAICDNLCSASSSDSSSYGCDKCDFFVHSSCLVDIPRQISHLFHPSCPLVLLTGVSYMCKGCEEAGSGLVYRCLKCDFQLDVKCALLSTVESKEAIKIQHFSHKHPLALRESKEFGGEVRCRACGENCLLDTCYGCSKRPCNFFLHKKCAAELPQELDHPFHPVHPLILLRDIPYYRCKACDDSYQDDKGLTYSCKKCDFQLDAKCALVPTIESEHAGKIQHSAHKHPLVTIHESKEFGNEVRCRACAKSCLAPCFGCTDKECNFFLHKHCAIELHPKQREIRHPFHPLHPLTLFSPPPLPNHETFQCSSCQWTDDWFLLRYHCAEGDFDLHIDCAKPKNSTVFKYEGHRHHLTYFDKIFSPVQCNSCHEDVQTCFFRCVACAFNIHIYCIPLTPKTIKHQSHSHHLTVTKSPFEYELISPDYADGSEDDEFYCDVCEEKRYKFESVYYCEECKFIAEVCCVINELLPSLIISEDESRVEGTFASRDDEIRKSKDKKRALEEEVERYRVELKSLEAKLERKNRELRKLKTDQFLNKYITSVTRMKENKESN